MKPLKDFTEDEKLRREYIMLISTCLHHCRNHGSRPFLLPENKKVIEYYMKDVSRNSVLANTSVEECASIFEKNLNKLLEGDKEQWDLLIEMVQKNSELVTKLAIATIHDARTHFRKKRTIKK